MGCASQNKEYDKMEEIKRKLKIQVMDNEIKIKYKNKCLVDFGMEIQNLESNIIQNQFTLSDIELKSKARLIAEKKKDIIRKEKEINNLTILNDIMKNNLEFIEGKIQEYKNAENIEEAKAILNQVYKMDFRKAYNNNVNYLLKNKERDEINMKDLEMGNNLYLSNNDEKVENADDILKRLINKPTSNYI